MATTLTTTDRLAVFVHRGGGRTARIWVARGTAIDVEVTSGTMWGVTLPGGRAATAVPREVIRRTA